MEINTKMLFRWAGYDIEMGKKEAEKPAPMRKPIDPKKALTPTARDMYIQFLRDALDDEKGLFVPPYNKDYDCVGKVVHRCIPPSCLFFTEQAAGDAEFHWRRYGRMGFGISKRAIFSHGGMPVIYTGSKRHRAEKAIDTLRRYLDRQESEIPSGCDEALEYLARLVKPTRIPASVRKERISGVDTSPDKKTTKRKKIDLTRYPSENIIRFLDEREWRLIHDSSSTSWRTDKRKKLWFRPELGKELQLIILPDNRTLQIALEEKDIREKLVDADRPPVQLLTTEALHKL